MNNIKEDSTEKTSEITTTEKYWDCECENNYIHPKSENSCSRCGAVSEEQPDSRINEVLAQGFAI